jgi:hypothetical protein
VFYFWGRVSYLVSFFNFPNCATVIFFPEFWGNKFMGVFGFLESIGMNESAKVAHHDASVVFTQKTPNTFFSPNASLFVIVIIFPPPGPTDLYFPPIHPALRVVPHPLNAKYYLS